MARKKLSDQSPPTRGEAERGRTLRPGPGEDLAKIDCHVPAEMKLRLKMLAAQEGRSMQSLVIEGLEHVLKERGPDV